MCVRKGFVRALFASAVAGALLGGPIAGAAAKTRIVHWQHSSPARDELMKELAQEFMRENPDIEVHFESFPLGGNDGFIPKLTVALTGGAGPDTFQIPSNMVPTWAANGVMQPLSESVLASRRIQEEFVPAAMGQLQHDGRFYALPTDTQTIVLFYQPELFEQAGLDPRKPPTTWDQLVSIAAKIHRRDGQGKTQVMGGATGGYGPVLHTLMMQTGTPLWDSSSNLPTFQSAGALKGFSFATELVTKHRVEDPAFGSRWTAFRASKLGMVYAHPGMIGSFRETAPNLAFRIAEVPTPQAGQRPINFLTNWALGISKRARNPEAATAWLAFVQSAQAQKRWTKLTGELPTRKDVLLLPEYQRDPLLAPVMRSVVSAVSRKWLSRDIDDALPRKAYDDVIKGGSSPTQALAWLHQSAIQAEVAERQKR